jgi:hypothetical protein
LRVGQVLFGLAENVQPLVGRHQVVEGLIGEAVREAEGMKVVVISDEWPATWGRVRLEYRKWLEISRKHPPKQQKPALAGMRTSLRTQSGRIAHFNIEFFNTIGRKRNFLQDNRCFDGICVCRLCG